MKKALHETLAESFDKQNWPMHDGKILIKPEHLKESLVHLAKMIDDSSQKVPQPHTQSGNSVTKFALLVFAMLLLFSACEKSQGQEPAQAKAIQSFRGETAFLSRKGEVLMRVSRPTQPVRSFQITLSKAAVTWTSDSTFILTERP